MYTPYMIKKMQIFLAGLPSYDGPDGDPPEAAVHSRANLRQNSSNSR